jgi:predicted ABC-type ATPase
VNLNSTKPDLVIIAGPNGAGKSTVSDFLLDNKSISWYVNADIIAKGISSPNRRGSDIEAGRIMLSQLSDALKSCSSISYESTMSGISWRSLITQAKNLGYIVTICYVAVRSPEVSIKRVKARVLHGGHDIPESTLRRRFSRSLRLFLTEYRDQVDYWYFFDNSENAAKLVAMRESFDGKEVVLDQEIFSFYKDAYARN